MKRLVVILVVGCGGGSSTPADAPGARDGSVDSPVDASSDAPADAAPVDDCPNRTAPVGEPQGPITPAEILAGDVTIRTATDALAISNYRAITGDVIVEATNFATLSLPNLEALGGTFRTIDNGTTMLVAIELPKLETLGNSFRTIHPSLTSVQTPNVETLGGTFQIRAAAIDVHCLRGAVAAPAIRGVLIANVSASTIDLDKLERGDLQLYAVPNLTALRLPRFTAGSLNLNPVAPFASLTTVELPVFDGGSVGIENAPVLATITLKPAAEIYLNLHALPALTSVSGLDTVTLTGLTVWDVDALTAVDASMTPQGYLYVSENAALTTLRIDGVTSIENRLLVDQNAALTTIDIPDLRTLGMEADADVVNNPMLPTCQAQAIADRLTTGTITISGNGSGTCP